jgi:hypothetical protein
MNIMMGSPVILVVFIFVLTGSSKAIQISRCVLLYGRFLDFLISSKTVAVLTELFLILLLHFYDIDFSSDMLLERDRDEWNTSSSRSLLAGRMDGQQF